MHSKYRTCYRLRLLFFLFRNFFPCKNVFLFFLSRLSVVCVICDRPTDRPQRLARAGVPFIARGLVTSSRPSTNPSVSPPASPPVRQPAHLSGRRRSGDVAIKIQLTRYRRREYSAVVRCSFRKVPFIVSFFSFFFFLVFLSMSYCVFFFLIFAIVDVGSGRIFRFVRRNVVVKIK